MEVGQVCGSNSVCFVTYLATCPERDSEYHSRWEESQQMSEALLSLWCPWWDCGDTVIPVYVGREVMPCSALDNENPGFSVQGQQLLGWGVAFLSPTCVFICEEPWSGGRRSFGRIVHAAWMLTLTLPCICFLILNELT